MFRDLLRVARCGAQQESEAGECDEPAVDIDAGWLGELIEANFGADAGAFQKHCERADYAAVADVFACVAEAFGCEGGEEFHHVNIMGVAHGMDKQVLLAHKAAMDAHLERIGIPVSYTNVFWGGRSEIKPSEISPIAYADFCRAANLDPESMRAQPRG